MTACRLDASSVVVVTGASAGVGRATAKALAARGCRVALLARGRAGLAGAAAEVEQAGGEPLVVPTDVGDAAAVEAGAAAVEREWGHIDCWINAAMATIFSPVGRITPEEFERATRTTYFGTVYGTLAALRRMRPRDAGIIVQVGSALSYQAIPLQAPYCGAKFAIRGFTDAVRSELIHDRSRVHVCMVQLSAHNTPQFEWGRTHLDRAPQPLPPIFEPEVAARAVAYAIVRPRRELWACWPAVKTIVASRVAPGLLERYLARKAWDGQLTDRPVSAAREDDLFAPVTRDAGTRGPFGDRARAASGQLRLSMHRRLAAALAAAAAAAVVMALAGMH